MLSLCPLCGVSSCCSSASGLWSHDSGNVTLKTPHDSKVPIVAKILAVSNSSLSNRRNRRLVVEVLNGRNLKAMDRGGTRYQRRIIIICLCSLYVMIFDVWKIHK